MISDLTLPAVRIALLGMGEAGSEIGRDLVGAGANVRAYDPKVESFPEGVEHRDSEAGAVADADLVLSANSVPDAPIALENALPALRPGCVYADLNTTSPALKEALAERAEASGALFCDVALMSPVPGHGVRTPMLVAGDGAQRFAELMAPLGATVTIQPGRAGAAISRKLLRSVFHKSVAGAIVEALEAADAAGCGEWLRGNISDELSSFGPHTLERMVYGTYKHARRRSEEMTASVEQLESLGITSRLAAGARDLLLDLAARQSAGTSAPA